MADGRPGKIEGFSETQQERYDGYYAQLEKCESGALAHELAIMLVMVPLLRVDKVLEQVRENTRIIRHNKRVSLTRKKQTRLQELCNKKKLSRDEHAEAVKLARDLGVKV